MVLVGFRRAATPGMSPSVFLNFKPCLSGLRRGQHKGSFSLTDAAAFTAIHGVITYNEGTSMSSNAMIKLAFGQALRAARDAKKISRATLAIRLGISPKTIQSWEMGRTFIEELGLIPEIESELDISISRLIALAMTGHATTLPPEPKGRAESELDIDGLSADEPVVPAYGSPAAVARSRPRPGPLPLFTNRLDQLPEPGEDVFNSWMTVPMLTTEAILRGVSELSPKDVVTHLIVPAAWTPRGGVMVACRMRDSSLEPTVPQGAALILDMRPLPPEKAIGKLVALRLAQKGLRIRRLIQDTATNRLYGAPAIEHSRGRMPFRPEHGDEVIGRVMGVVSEVD